MHEINKLKQMVDIPQMIAIIRNLNTKLLLYHKRESNMKIIEIYIEKTILLGSKILLDTDLKIILLKA